jgi:hypothetical protein
MTVDEINFAMANRQPVFLARGSVEILKPLSVRGIAKIIRDEFEVERGKEPYFVDVILRDATGRSEVHARPDQLDPAEPEKFGDMMRAYKQLKERKVAENENA